MTERIISRGLDAPAKFAPTLEVRKAMHGTQEASNDGRVRVRIIHGLNISQKELTYLLQKSTSHQKPSTTRMILGERLVGVNHRAPPTSTHQDGNQKSTPCNKFFTQLLPYVHAMGLANFNTSIL